jgi:hypothetical protein
MAIPLDEWKGYIGGALWRLSSEQYQRLAWFNKHREQTSPEEQICQLLNDYLFDEFLLAQPLSEQQRSSANRLIAGLKSYGGSSNTPINPYRAIDDPKWSKIRLLAGEAMTDLGSLIVIITDVER